MLVLLIIVVILRGPVNRKTYTVREAAEILGISNNSAYEGVKSGEIPSVRVGKRILIPKAALDNMLSINRCSGEEFSSK